MKKLTSSNPSFSYKTVGTVNITTPDEITEKVTHARSAQPAWESLGLDGRISTLSTLRAIFKENHSELAEITSSEMGMPISQANGNIDAGLAYLDWYIENAKACLSPEISYADNDEINEIHYLPVGVIASIISWNFPFSIFLWHVGQSLLAGNTIVFKHSEEASLIGVAIDRMFKEAKVPSGVFTTVYGGAAEGEHLVKQDIDMITFTGSTNAGKKLYQIGAEKFIPVLVELGGSAPGVVFKDADLDSTIESLYIKRFLNCGQCCDGLKRLIVHESRFDEVVERLRTLIATKKLGLSNDPETEIGPLASRQQLDSISRQVTDAVAKGAKVICGGNTPPNLDGAFYEPTLLTNITKDMAVWKEEVFGPVLPIISFSDYDDAMALANDTEYGLGGYIFTEDKALFRQSAADIKTGMLAQNSTSYVKPCNPFGGVKASGMSKENGKFGFHEVCQTKLISRDA